MIEGMVDTPGASLHYVQEGMGPDIVWIPGGDMKSTVYRDQTAAFSGNYRCTSYDPRGIGGTVTAVAGDWTMGDMADDCAALIRQLCEPPVTLVGMSMGASTALETAIRYPELVRLAIAIGVSSKKTGFLLDWEEAEIAYFNAGIEMPLDFALCHYAALYYPAQALADIEVWQRIKPLILEWLGGRDPEGASGQWNACLNYNPLPGLPGCKVPIHVIACEQDKVTPPSHGEEVARAAGNGHFHLVGGLGHCSMFGHAPGVVNDLIGDILES